MKFTLKEDRYLLEAEDDQDREVLKIIEKRADEVRIEIPTRLFRDLEIIIYIPAKFPLAARGANVTTKAACTLAQGERTSHSSTTGDGVEPFQPGVGSQHNKGRALPDIRR